MPTKRLGRGLDALFGGESADFLNPEQGEREPSRLPITSVEPNPGQPRRSFEKEPMEELAESIRMHGVISPIAVRRMEDGSYRIIAGERRWRAARMAGLKEIPAVVLDTDDREAMEMALIENLQRKDLNPIEEAMGYKSLIESHGLTQEDAAERVGKSRPVVANSLRLLTLPQKVIALLEKGDLSGGHARALAGLSSNKLKVELAERAVKEGLSVRQVERLSKSAPVPERKKAPKAKGLNYFGAIEEDLTKRYGRKVRISEGKDKGRIELEYYGSDDFERLVEALSALKL